MMGGMGENHLTPQPIQKEVKIGDLGGGGGGGIKLGWFTNVKEPFSGVSTDFRPIYTKTRKFKFSDKVTLLLEKYTLNKQSYLYLNIRLASLFIASVSLKTSSEEQR